MTLHKKFLIGVDLGQSHDPSALVVNERIEQGDVRALYHMRFLKRFPLQMTYPDVLCSVRTIIEQPEIADKSALLVDTTGVGAPIVDILRDMKLPCKLVPVLITAGTAVTFDGRRWHVPKRNLATAVKLLLDSERIKISTRIQQHKLLVRELQNFKVKITAKANDTYEAWRENDHDDLVLATAMCCWYAERKHKEMFADEKPSIDPQQMGGQVIERIDENTERIQIYPPASTQIAQEGWSWRDVKRYAR